MNANVGAAFMDYENRLRALSMAQLLEELRGAEDHLQEAKARLAQEEAEANDQEMQAEEEREEIIRQILATNREAALYQ